MYVGHSCTTWCHELSYHCFPLCWWLRQLTVKTILFRNIVAIDPTDCNNLRSVYCKSHKNAWKIHDRFNTHFSFSAGLTHTTSSSSPASLCKGRSLVSEIPDILEWNPWHCLTPPLQLSQGPHLRHRYIYQAIDATSAGHALLLTENTCSLDTFSLCNRLISRIQNSNWPFNFKKR